MTEQEIREKGAEARRKYAREWRKKNKGKQEEYNRRYWERRALREAQEREETEAK